MLRLPSLRPRRRSRRCPIKRDEHPEAEQRLRAALHFTYFMETGGVPPEKILTQLLEIKTEFEAATSSTYSSNISK